MAYSKRGTYKRENVRETRLTVRITEEQKKTLQAAAARKQQTVSEYVRKQIKNIA